MHPILVFILIVLVRALTVTFGYLRHINKLKMRLTVGFFFGLVEVALYLIIIALALEQIRNNYTYAIFYGIGFALGNVFGFLFELLVPLGSAEIMIFAPQGHNIADRIHEAGFAATSLSGCGLQGDVEVIYIFLLKRDVKRLLALIPKAEGIFYTIDYGVKANKISRWT
jgi:uncharacterized protein YebE (UPF0316 family)